MSRQRCLLIASFLVLGLSVVHSEPTNTSPPPPCSTPACRESAAFISAALNTSADPCNDFYEFACGGWLAKHDIKESEVSAEQFTMLNSKMTKQIQALLAGYNLTAPQTSTGSNAIALASYAYQKCLQQGNATAEEGLRQLKEVIETILGSQWTIGQAVRTADRSWHQNYVHTFASGAYAPIVSIGWFPDPDNKSHGILYLSSEELGIDDHTMKNLSSNPKLVTAYKDYIRKSAHLFCGTNCPTLEQDIEDIIHLESALAQLKQSPEDARDPTKSSTLPIHQLSDKSHFNWLAEIFTPIEKALGLSPRIKDTDPVKVTDINYTTRAVQLLQKTPPRTVTNLIGWRLVAKYGSYASEQLRETAFEYTKARSGLAKKTDRSDMCYFHLGTWPSGLLIFATSRLFIDRYFSPAEKDEAQTMVNDIQSSFRELLEKNTWLDATTKKNSLTKLNRVTKNVAYPEWLLHDDKLDALYRLNNRSFTQELLAGKNYLLSLVKFSRNANQYAVAMMKDSWLESGWILSPATVNAAYFPQQNSITIPAGILKSPFFAAQRPYAINYGFLATIIGHEFSHGFDDQGRMYDEVGHYRDWWTAEAVKRFHDRSECYVRQYGALTEPMSGLKVNGRLELGENIADNSGVHVAFNAFQHRQARQPSPRLADLAKYSPEQLFFISWAHPWCMKYRPEIMKLSILYDPHAPGQFRATIPLANLPDFAKAFSCPVGSKMNPKERCSMW